MENRSKDKPTEVADSSVERFEHGGNQQSAISRLPPALTRTQLDLLSSEERALRRAQRFGLAAINTERTPESATVVNNKLAPESDRNGQTEKRPREDTTPSHSEKRARTNFATPSGHGTSLEASIANPLASEPNNTAEDDLEEGEMPSSEPVILSTSPNTESAPTTIYLGIRTSSVEIPLAKVDDHGEEGVGYKDVTDFIAKVTSAPREPMKKIKFQELETLLSTYTNEDDENFLEDYHERSVAGLKPVDSEDYRPGLLMKRMMAVRARDPKAKDKLGTTTFRDNNGVIWQVKWQILLQIMGASGEDPSCAIVTSKGMTGMSSLPAHRKPLYVEMRHSKDKHFQKQGPHQELVLESSGFTPTPSTMLCMSKWLTIQPGDSKTFALGYLDGYSTQWVKEMVVHGFQIGKLPRLLNSEKAQRKVIAYGEGITERLKLRFHKDEESDDESDGEVKLISKKPSLLSRMTTKDDQPLEQHVKSRKNGRDTGSVSRRFST